MQALRSYIKTARIADGPLLPSSHRRETAGRLTTRAIHWQMSRLFREVGIDKTPHGLRHYFTTTLLEQYRGDTLEVRRYTRHASTEMLAIYDDRRRQRQDLPRFHSAFSEVVL